MNDSIKNKSKFIGERKALKEFVGKTVVIQSYNILQSKKKDNERGYYYEFQISLFEKDENGKKVLKHYTTWYSGNHIVSFFDKCESGEIKLPIKVKIKKLYGNSLWFEGYNFFDEERYKELSDIAMTLLSDEDDA